MMTAKLNVNIDHVATIREARKTIEPSVLVAAAICEQAGADGITVHLRGDRRHIQDRDIELLRDVVTTYLNVEMAATDEMVAIAKRTKPDAVSLVPESANEITTEGGLNVIDNFETVKAAVEKLKAAGIFVSIFIDPDPEQITAAKNTGADQVELCTAEYAELTLVEPDTAVMSEPGAIATGFRNDDSPLSPQAESALSRIIEAAAHAKSLGLIVAAGHGLTTANVSALAACPEITEFNIGHHIISRAVFVGLNQAVTEMIEAISG
ncbi:MAG: pyridoxine 5'-phosphate synthase [Pyrinomonadaceae bacterium]